jgi:hypothetical protein
MCARPQVMRKKADSATEVGKATSPGVAKIAIAKEARSTLLPPAAHALPATNALLPERGGAGSRSGSPAASDCRHGTAHGHGPGDTASLPASREASTSPIESDLLRYLSAHILPKQTLATPSVGGQDSAPGDDVTSFVIGCEEYLQGVIRLVKSDCPEVMLDMATFATAMQHAYAAVSVEAPAPGQG